MLTYVPYVRSGAFNSDKLKAMAKLNDNKVQLNVSRQALKNHMVRHLEVQKKTEKDAVVGKKLTRP